MTLQVIPDALRTVSRRVYHFRASSKTSAPYFIWAEDGSGQDFHADDAVEEQVIHGSVDYYTKRENDPAVAQAQAALTAAGVPWRLNSIQYEDDTGFIHYEWLWEVV